MVNWERWRNYANDKINDYLHLGYPPFSAGSNDEIWVNVYHWKKVLERPLYQGEDEEFNLTEEGWDLVTR